MAVVITLDGPTREFHVLPAWRVVPVTCRCCVDGRPVLSDTEAALVIDLAGGRSGDWWAERCPVRAGRHMVRRTHHGRGTAGAWLTWRVAVLASLVATVVLVLPLLGRM
ncbi:hypothetical protein [Longispora urticae]